MGKTYQNEQIDTNQPAVAEVVSVALAELAGEVQEGLLALAVGTGLQVMAAMMEADVTAACGPRGRHNPERSATRHGHGAGSVTLGGRRVPVVRPRMRAVDGSGELPVPTYELFSQTEVLGRMAMERMEGWADGALAVPVGHESARAGLSRPRARRGVVRSLARVQQSPRRTGPATCRSVPTLEVRRAPAPLVACASSHRRRRCSRCDSAHT